MTRSWVSAALDWLESEPAVVRIVVAQVSGSGPREPGAFMLVGRNGFEGTIGGGRFEWESIAAARGLLDDASSAARLNTIVLAADVGQCCGGVVGVWLERFTREDVGFLRHVREKGALDHAVLSSTVKGSVVERRLVCGNVSERDMGGDDLARGEEASAERRGGDLVAAQAEELLRQPRGSASPRVVRDIAGGIRFLERLDDEFPAVWLYGAGHVGQALARIFAGLPLRLTWIDSRAELFPALEFEGVQIRRDADSLRTVSDAPAGACFLVMTHSHPLDFALCQAILERNDFAWLGLIGSESKAARFRSRLKKAGVSPETLARLVCPIGVEGIESKWPAAIAVGVAAQVMQRISVAARKGHGGGHARVVFDPASDCGRESCSTCGTAAAGPVTGRS